MRFELRPMNRDYAHAIADWHYGGIHTFYDMDQDVEDLEELLDQHSWSGKYWAVVDDRGDLIGFFCFEMEDDTLTVGLGMRPDYTGRGLGQAFVETGLEHARRHFNPLTFSLLVATLNQRAIRVYERLGFKPDGVFVRETNGGRFEFLRMVRAS